MNKYPLIKLFAEAFGGTKRPSGAVPKAQPKQSREAAQMAIMKAKLKRARKKTKRANVLHGTTLGD